MWLGVVTAFAASTAAAFGSSGAGELATAATVSNDAWWRFFGRLHPAVVHFPIALLIVAAVIEIARTLWRKPRSPNAALPIVWLAAISAIVAAALGWINAEHEPHGESIADTLFWHRWLGVAVAVIASLAALLSLADRWWHRAGPRVAYRTTLVVGGLLVGYVGYLGAEIVYGQGHLFEVFEDADDAAPPPIFSDTTDTDSSDDPATGVESPSDEPGEVRLSEAFFVQRVMPIFEARCVDCHGPERKRGDLRVDTLAHLFDRDPEEWVVVPGDPDASLLYQRITLPADDRKRMPARGDKLDDDQIATIRAWIEGATLDADSATSDPAADTVDATEIYPESTAAVTLDYEPTVAPLDEAAQAARDAAFTRIQEAGGVATPVAAGADAVDANLSLIDAGLDDDRLAELLAGLDPSLVWLNLASTGVTDEGVATLDRFEELRRLNLAETGVTDASISSIVTLPKLEYLNLHGTAITDAGLAGLIEAAALRKVYLWNAAVSPDGVAAFIEKRPEVAVVVGGTSAESDDGG